MVEVNDIDLLSALAVPAPGREQSPPNTNFASVRGNTNLNPIVAGASAQENTDVVAAEIGEAEKDKENLYCICRKPYNEKTDAFMM